MEYFFPGYEVVIFGFDWGDIYGNLYGYGYVRDGAGKTHMLLISTIYWSCQHWFEVQFDEPNMSPTDMKAINTFDSQFSEQSFA